MDSPCKVCGSTESENGWAIVSESRFLVAVNEETQTAYILNKDDCFCDICNRLMTFYYRQKGQ